MTAETHAARQAELKRRSSGRLMIFGFLSPTLAILLFMVAYPIFSLIYYSFYNFSALRQGAMKPVGLGNYRFLLSDPELWERFVFTGKFVFIWVALQMLMIWAFARAYYFAFYVIEHYIDPLHRFSGLLDFLRYVVCRRRDPPPGNHP